MQKKIKHEWIYEQSPTEVWKYLTQPDLIALWLMPNNFKPVLGQEFQFKTNAMPSLDLNGIFHCKILEIEPNRKLSYRWKGGSGNGFFTLDTICEWTLEPLKNGTKLFLKHSGFTDNNKELFIGMTDGWQKNVQKMFNHMNVLK
jgi:uncharacterized protein YndB with AHSA1/START domain